MAPRVTTRIAAGPSTADIRAAPGNASGTIEKGVTPDDVAHSTDVPVA